MVSFDIEEKVPKMILSKKTKKRLRDVTFAIMIFLTLIGSALNSLGLVNNQNVINVNGCPSVTLKTLAITMCQDKVYLKFPQKTEEPAIQWKREQLEDIAGIIQYMSTSDLISNDFKFYYLPDLVLFKSNGTVGAHFRGIVVDIVDLNEALKIVKTT